MMGRESFERSLFCLRTKIGRRRNRRQYDDIALAAPMRQWQMRLTMYCVTASWHCKKKWKSLFCLKKSSLKGCCCCFFFVVELELFRAVGSWARKCRCRMLGVGCMLVFVAKEASVVVGESVANKGKTTCRSSSPEFCRLMSARFLKCDDRRATITSLVSWRPYVSEPKRRHWRASVGSGSSNETSQQE